MNLGIKNKIYDIFIYAFITMVILICVIPFLHVASLSLSSTPAVMSQKVTILPVEFNLEAYEKVFSDSSMLQSLKVSIEVTTIFSALGLLITILLAYPLSRKDLKGKTIFMMLVLFTFYFNAGIIPNFINIFKLGLMDSIWALILPLALSPYNMILMKTFFQVSIPESLEESARLDGCSHLGILTRIVIPLSKPIIATILLFYAVGRWNAFQDAFFYISSREIYPLQLKLYFLIAASMTAPSLGEGGDIMQQLPPEVVKAASIMFATLPIIIVYPWLQKYFVKGVMIGAVKG